MQAYSVVGNESRSRGTAIARTKDEVQHSQVLHSLLRPDFELNKSIELPGETGLHLDIQGPVLRKISVDGKSLSNAEKHNIDLTSKNTLLLEWEDQDKTRHKLSLKTVKLDQQNLTEDHRAKLAQTLDEKVKDAVMGRDFPDEYRWLSHMVDLKAAAENLGIRTFRFETGTKLRASYEGALPGKETSLGQTISISNEIYEQRTLDFLKTLRGGVDEELGVLGGLTQNLSVMEAAGIKKARLFDVNPFEIFTQLRQIETYNKTATYVDAGNNTHALPEGEIKIIWENMHEGVSRIAEKKAYLIHVSNIVTVPVKSVESSPKDLAQVGGGYGGIVAFKELLEAVSKNKNILENSRIMITSPHSSDLVVIKKGKEGLMLEYAQLGRAQVDKAWMNRMLSTVGDDSQFRNMLLGMKAIPGTTEEDMKWFSKQK